jgi:predicted RNA binding protein YcfA (HicA-like mRNA interferase family)
LTAKPRAVTKSGTLRTILKQAAIDPDAFLAA